MNCLLSRRRIALLLALLALVAAYAVVLLVWRWKAPSMVRERLEIVTGRRVTVGAVGLDWHLDLVARDIVVAGAPPFDSQSLARIDRATIRLRGARGLLGPSEILVDGADIDYLATLEGDNLRGLAVSRKGVRPPPARFEGGTMPRMTVRNARLRGSLAFSRGPKLALRAPEAEIERDGKGRWVARLRDLVVDADGVASLRASAITVEATRGGVTTLTGSGVAVEIPGGGPLVDHLVLDGKISPPDFTFDLHSNEAPDRQVAVTVSWNAGSAELSTHLRDLPLRALGALAGGRALGVENARASLQAHVAVDRPALRAELALSGKVVALDILHPAVDTTPWRNQSGWFSLRGLADLTSTRVEVQDAELKALGATLKMKGGFEDMSAPRGELTIATPPREPIPCSTLLYGQPAPVRQALHGLDLEGSLGATLALRFDARAWEDLELEVSLDPICKVKHEARALAELLPALREPKTALAPPESKLALGSYHPDFVPLAHMPPHLPSAFITSEDRKFFRHRGFDVDMIRRALAQDLANRSFDRGASTITQQLAKNLFLTHRRTLARKLEEAVLTWRLHTLLSKERVLELYLNVIELGPGIRGVKQAARKYFGKEVGELTPIESAHLAALTPNPHVLARRFRDGQVDEGWQGRLYDLLGMMKRHGRLSADELAAARASKLELRDLGRDPALGRPN
jgi:hypothetical protein